MGQDTKIQWCHHTFNPWRGAEKHGRVGDVTPITIEVHGNPAGQTRVQPIVRGGRATMYRQTHKRDANGVKIALPATTWREAVADAVQAAYAAPRRTAEESWPSLPISVPVRVDIYLRIARPKFMQTRKWPEGEMPCGAKPDRDNADKLILDVLVSCGVLLDDKLVSDGRITKRYVAKGAAPGATITIIEDRDE